MAHAPATQEAVPMRTVFWFEFSRLCYTMGLGFFVQKPAQFDELRKVILAHPRKWTHAVKQAEDAGMHFGCYNSYKKTGAGCTQGAAALFECKGHVVLLYRWNLEHIGSTALIDELKADLPRHFRYIKSL